MSRVRDIYVPVTKRLVFFKFWNQWIRVVLIRTRIQVTDLYLDPLFSMAFKMPIKKCWVFLLVTYFTQQSSSNKLLRSRETVEIMIFFIFWLVDGRIRIGSVYGRPITLRLRIRNNDWNMFQFVFTGISLKLSFWSVPESFLISELCGTECRMDFSC